MSTHDLLPLNVFLIVLAPRWLGYAIKSPGVESTFDLRRYNNIVTEISARDIIGDRGNIRCNAKTRDNCPSEYFIFPYSIRYQ